MGRPPDQDGAESLMAAHLPIHVIARRSQGVRTRASADRRRDAASAPEAEFREGGRGTRIPPDAQAVVPYRSTPNRTPPRARRASGAHRCRLGRRGCVPLVPRRVADADPSRTFLQIQVVRHPPARIHHRGNGKTQASGRCEDRSRVVWAMRRAPRPDPRTTS
jgi:hypothetical protein